MKFQSNKNLSIFLKEFFFRNCLIHEITHNYVLSDCEKEQGHLQASAEDPFIQGRQTGGRADGRTGGRADGRTGGRAGGRAGGRTGGRADGRTDGCSLRLADRY